MNYECPICGRMTATAVNMCKHMVNTGTRFEEHTEWIESHSVSYTEILGLKDGKLGKGSYKALTVVIEKECKIQK